MLELDHVTRRFGPVTALDAVSFDVERGQVLGFVGSNGAGKTTAMRIIMGVLDADEGEVRFDGQRIDPRRRRRFGYLPEERGLYPKVPLLRQLTYLGRLHGMGRRRAREASVDMLARLGLGEQVPQRLERLSLGNQQRAQLAAALIHDPSLLVLDEPFSGLDPLGVDALVEVIEERARAGVPVLFSSHQLDLVERLCDAVAIIHEGRIAAHGTVEALRQRSRARMLEVEVESDPRLAAERVDGLGAGRSGIRVVERSDGRVLLELDERIDEQVLLDEARAIGRVTRFAFHRPTLAEVYRQVLDR